MSRQCFIGKFASGEATWLSRYSFSLRKHEKLFDQAPMKDAIGTEQLSGREPDHDGDDDRPHRERYSEDDDVVPEAPGHGAKMRESRTKPKGSSL